MADAQPTEIGAHDVAETLTYAADSIALDRDYQLPADGPLKPGMDRAEKLLRRMADSARKAGLYRQLTASEYNAAWHAVEGAAGQEGADPGTVLHAVLDRLGIEWQAAARPAAVSAAVEAGE